MIGHDAFRAGAQLSLLHTVRWLTEHYPATFTLLLKGGGDLFEEYAGLLPTRVLRPSQDSRLTRPSLLWRLFRRLRSPQRRQTLDVSKIDLIYVNSVASLDLLLDLPSPGRCPVICHVHELEMGMRHFCGLERFRQAQRHIDGYIAVSRAASNNLVTNHGILSARIHQVYGGLPLPDRDAIAGLRATTRDSLRIPRDAFVVGGCGVLAWNKAPDLFAQIARRVVQGGPPRQVHFVWVGGPLSGGGFDILTHDLQRMRLQDLVHFVGHQQDPIRYFSMFDVFLLTSREESLSLACLEAAALEVPTICFEDGGGPLEFVEDDAGFVVPYLDVERAADCVRTLAGSESLRLTLGRRAADKVKARHDINVVGPQIAAVLDKYLP